jgi:hypothetical protein
VSHLGERVSALVDGQLSLDAMERAYSHLAHCRECRDAVEAERLMKARLSCLPAPEPETDLLGRLAAIGGFPGQAPCRPRAESFPVREHSPSSSVFSSGSSSLLPPAAALRGSSRPPARRLSRRLRPSAKPSARPAGRSAFPDTFGPDRHSSVKRNAGHRVRMAGAVLGFLGVMGAGVSGLMFVSSAGDSPTPAKVPFDSFVVERPTMTPTLTMKPVASSSSTMVMSPSASPVRSSRSPSASSGGNAVQSR